MSHTPTEEQQAIVDHFRQHRSHLVIEAGAGTGKTSTLKLLAAQFPRAKGVYVAYNRSIADDAAKAFPPSVLCKTAHGLAFGSVGRRFAHRLRTPRMPARETARILGIREPVKLAENLAPLAPTQIARLVMETIGRFCFSADELPAARHVPRMAGLDDPATHKALCSVVVPLAARAWAEDLSNVDGRLKFSHDCYLKLWQLTRPQLPADFVLLDEAQDSNPAVADVVTSQNSTQIMVGDRSQSIYGWRGAEDAMTTFGGTRFVLSQSFRFGPTIAVEANKFLSLLDAPLRLTGFDPIASEVGPVDAPDAILCRTNGGAMSRAMGEISLGRDVALVGGGADIKRLAEAALSLRQGRGTEHPELIAFSTWAEVQDHVEQDSAGSDLRAMVTLIDRHGPQEVIRTCDRLVDERDADVVVSTAHRSKGREWSSVRIADDFREPREDERGEIILSDDELMLGYVAVTRSKLTLDRGSLEWVDQFVTIPAPVSVERIRPVAHVPPAEPPRSLSAEELEDLAAELAELAALDEPGDLGPLLPPPVMVVPSPAPVRQRPAPLAVGEFPPWMSPAQRAAVSR